MAWISVRQAQAPEAAVIHGMLQEAAQWVDALGVVMWDESELDPDRVDREVAAGQFFLAEVDGEPAGAVRFQLEDRLFWPHVAPGEAFYIHRLAVARTFAGRGYAHAMLDWAADEARRKGRPFLRLDCEPRGKLLALYRSAGYRSIDPKPIQVGEHFVVRHERRV